MEDLRWQWRERGEAAVRRKRSQGIQFGEIFSFPKKVMKVKLILSEIMPKKKEVDRIARTYCEQGFEKGVLVNSEFPTGRTESNKENRDSFKK